MANPLKKIFGSKPTPQKKGSSFKQAHYLNSLSSSELLDVLQFSERRFFERDNSLLTDKKVLYFSHPHNNYLREKILKNKPALFLDYQIEVQKGEWPASVVPLHGGLKQLPLKKGIVSSAILPVATLHEKEWGSLLPEISRVIEQGGRFYGSFISPSLELLLTNQNPNSDFTLQNSVGRYFEILRASHLYVEECAEVVVDRDLHPFFIYSGEDYFNDYRGVPLVTFFRAVKYEGKVQK